MKAEIQDQNLSGDESSLMEHVALECMNAIEAKDKKSFLDAFHVLVSDVVDRMTSQMDEQGEGK